MSQVQRHWSTGDGAVVKGALLDSVHPPRLSWDLHGDIAETPPGTDRPPLALGFLEDSERHGWHRETMSPHFFSMFTDPGNLGKVFPSVKWLLCFLGAGVLVSDSRIFFFFLWKSNPLRSLVDINYIRYVPFTDESVLLFDTIHGLLVRKPLGLRDETNKIRFQDCSFQTVTPVEESRLDYDRWNFLSLGTKICKPKRLFRGQENLTLIGMENRKYKEMTSHSVKWWMRGE